MGCDRHQKVLSNIPCYIIFDFLWPERPEKKTMWGRTGRAHCGIIQQAVKQGHTSNMITVYFLHEDKVCGALIWCDFLATSRKSPNILTHAQVLNISTDDVCSITFLCDDGHRLWVCVCCCGLVVEEQMLCCWALVTALTRAAPCRLSF